MIVFLIPNCLDHPYAQPGQVDKTPSSLVVAEEAGAACRESGLALWSPGSLWKQSKIMSATTKNAVKENISMNIRKCQKGGI